MAPDLTISRKVGVWIFKPGDNTMRLRRDVGAKFAAAPDLTISRKVGERFPKLYDGAMVALVVRS